MEGFILNDEKNCRMCKEDSALEQSKNIYTIKEIVMMRTKIYDFNTSIYISAIQRLVFHLPHVLILGTNHCGEMQRTAFKQRELFQDVIFRRDYANRLVAIFDNQIQS